VRSRDEVLAVVSHDLRNHLGVVVFAAAQLARRAGAAELAALGPLVGQIRRAASGMERIMSDLLDVTRIESGRLMIELTDVDAAEVVREAIDIFAVLADRQGFALRATLDELAGVRLSCDRGRVVQVLSNLLGNALKFVPPGRGIEVGGYRAGREAVIFVRDEGPGLRPNDLPHLFDRYWQAEQKHAKRGIGLGLTIVKGIVEGHGGRVWAESPPGQGATFSFSLPLAAGA
jgi:signal transduction histidine kinase